MPGAAGTSADIKAGRGTVSFGYRQVYADRYFLNSKIFREANRVQQPTRFWNTMDVTGTYQVTKMTNLQVTLPIQINQASSLLPTTPDPLGPSYRQYLNTAGVGDLLLIGRRWIFDPEQAKKGNILVGVGLKLPTGNFRGNNVWTGGNINSPAIRKPAPLTIMIGDGGVDVLLEALGYKVVNFPVRNTNAFAVASYLFTPGNTTGILSQNELVGPPISTSPLTQNSLVNTIPDIYSVRTGMIVPYPIKEHARLQPLSLLMSYRWEGSPEYDFIGRSDGFRQPGFFMAVELGLFYQTRKHLVQVSCPISFVRYAVRDGSEGYNSPAPRTTAFSPASLGLRYTYFF